MTESPLLPIPPFVFPLSFLHPFRTNKQRADGRLTVSNSASSSSSESEPTVSIDDRAKTRVARASPAPSRSSEPTLKAFPTFYNNPVITDGSFYKGTENVTLCGGSRGDEAAPLPSSGPDASSSLPPFPPPFRFLAPNFNNSNPRTCPYQLFLQRIIFPPRSRRKSFDAATNLRSQRRQASPSPSSTFPLPSCIVTSPSKGRIV